MSTQTLTKELKKSSLIRMKVPTEQVDTFVERISSLPEDKKRKTLEIVKKAAKAFSSFAAEETRNTQEFLERLSKFRVKTKNKYRKTGKTLNRTADLMASLKSKIKKQK